MEDPEQWAEDCPDRVFRNWYASYRCEPFGGETALLTRIVCLLYVIAGKGSDFEKVCLATDALMKTMMPSDWIGNDSEQSSKTFDPKAIKAKLKAMSSVMEKAFA